MAIPNTWVAVPKGDYWVVQTQDGRIVATTSTGKEAKKNAKLIAASPYMLEALKAVVANLEGITKRGRAVKTLPSLPAELSSN